MHASVQMFHPPFSDAQCALKSSQDGSGTGEASRDDAKASLCCKDRRHCPTSDETDGHDNVQRAVDVPQQLMVVQLPGKLSFEVFDLSLIHCFMAGIELTTSRPLAADELSMTTRPSGNPGLSPQWQRQQPVANLIPRTPGVSNQIHRANGDCVLT